MEQDRKTFGPDIRTIGDLVIWFAPDGEPILLSGKLMGFDRVRTIGVNGNNDADWLDRLLPF